MSWQPCDPPDIADREHGPVLLTVRPKRRDLGGFEVGRVLPASERRTVGPFVFLDVIGPAAFPPGRGIDVRPHPHIGLATVTYLFAGEIVHRDSLGSVQPIRPGAVNWMTAGRGIVHSERTGDGPRAEGQILHGLQAWVALPKPEEEREPDFAHHPADALPVTTAGGSTVRVVAGSGFGACAPVTVLWPTIFAEMTLTPGSRLPVPADYEERGVLAVNGTPTLDGQPMEIGDLHLLRPGSEPEVAAEASARVMLIGGAPLDAPRHVWWNFVSSSEERIAQAKADWTAGRFARVPGESEFIPLPAG